MFNFDAQVNRRNTDSVKWNIPDSELPMWIADMDFVTAPEIVAALQKRVEHGVFGYSFLSDEWYSAYVNWWKVRHSFEMKKEWLVFCTSVVPALSSAIRKLTTVGENVLIQSPVYNMFYNCISDNGRVLLESPLVYDGENYSIDFADLESKLALPQTTMMLLCNPHNPVGKIWDRDTLERIGELCYKHHVVVVADEIHCDVTEPGYDYTPFASVSDKCRENSVTCIAPTKTFNLAGVQTAAVMVPNENLRHKMDRALNTDEVGKANAFAEAATVAAYNEGAPWLDELRAYIHDNRRIAREFLEVELPSVKLVASQATYLLWLDCSRLHGNSAELSQFLRSEAGLYLVPGIRYGQAGSSFLRMNIACPQETLKDGLNRLKKGVLAYER